MSHSWNGIIHHPLIHTLFQDNITKSHFHPIASFWNQLHIYLKKWSSPLIPTPPPLCAKVQDPHSEFRAQISPTSTSNKWLPLAKLVVKSATQQNGTKAIQNRQRSGWSEVWKINQGSRNVRCLTFAVEKKKRTNAKKLLQLQSLFGLQLLHP